MAQTVLRFDGSCVDNGKKTNQASFGFVIYDEDQTLALGCGKLPYGCHTTNTAEFEGLLYGLEKAVELGIKDLLVIGDSKLVINWMRFKKSKKPHIQCLIMQGLDLVKKMKIVNFTWEGRDNNTVADALCHEAMYQHTVTTLGHLIVPILDKQPLKKSDENKLLIEQAKMIARNWPIIIQPGLFNDKLWKEADDEH